MATFFGCFFGLIAWFVVRYILAGLYTVNQNERAVKTSFGRAERIKGATTLEDPIAEYLRPEEKERYRYPQVRVIPPGGPYFKWPWEKIYKVSVATQTVSMAFDPENPQANQAGHGAGGGHQRPTQYRLAGPNSLPCLRAEFVRLSVWGQTAHCACDGLFCVHSARAHRQF